MNIEYMNDDIQQKYQQQKSDEIDVKIIHLLDENNFKLVQIPQHNDPIFFAASYSIFNTHHYVEQVKFLCYQILEQMIKNKNLPLKLNIFIQNPSLLQNYKENPSLSGFERVNFELISLVFQVKIRIFNISKDDYLQATYFNNKFVKEKDFLKVGSYYHPIFSNQLFEIYKISQSIILELVKKKFQINFKQNNNPIFELKKNNYQINDQFQFIEDDHIYFLDKQDEQQPKRKHKKSLSDIIISENNENKNKKDNYYNMFGANPPNEILKLFQDQKQPSSTFNKNNYFLNDIFNIEQKHKSSEQDFRTSKNLHKYSDIPLNPKVLLELDDVENQKIKKTSSNSHFQTEVNSSFGFQDQIKNLTDENLNTSNSQSSFSYTTSQAKPLEIGVRSNGVLKFFDEKKNYGFIVKDDDFKDIFVHYDDLQKANISKEFLNTAKLGNVIRFSFTCMEYIGKYNKSRKAMDLELIQPQQSQQISSSFIFNQMNNLTNIHHHHYIQNNYQNNKMLGDYPFLKE